MLSVPIELINVIVPLMPPFSNPVWEHVQVLLAGAILAPGQRTVTAALRVLGRSQEKHFQTSHRVLNRAVWSALGSRGRKGSPANGALIMLMEDCMDLLGTNSVLRKWLWLPERKWGPYGFGPGYPRAMFVLLTLVFLVECAHGVRLAMKYPWLLHDRMLLGIIPLVMMFPFTWFVYLRMHRRLERLAKEVSPQYQRVVEELQAALIVFTLGVYILSGVGLNLISRLLRMAH